MAHKTIQLLYFFEEADRRRVKEEKSLELYANRHFTERKVTVADVEQWMHGQLVHGEVVHYVFGAENIDANEAAKTLSVASGIGVLPQMTLPLNMIGVFTSQRLLVLLLGQNLAEMNVHEYA